MQTVPSTLTRRKKSLCRKLPDLPHEPSGTTECYVCKRQAVSTTTGSCRRAGTHGSRTTTMGLQSGISASLRQNRQRQRTEKRTRTNVSSLLGFMRFCGIRKPGRRRSTSCEQARRLQPVAYSLDAGLRQTTNTPTTPAPLPPAPVAIHGKPRGNGASIV